MKQALLVGEEREFDLKNRKLCIAVSAMDVYVVSPLNELGLDLQTRNMHGWDT